MSNGQVHLDYGLWYRPQFLASCLFSASKYTLIDFNLDNFLKQSYLDIDTKQHHFLALTLHTLRCEEIST